MSDRNSPYANKKCGDRFLRLYNRNLFQVAYKVRDFYMISNSAINGCFWQGSLESVAKNLYDVYFGDNQINLLTIALNPQLAMCEVQFKAPIPIPDALTKTPQDQNRERQADVSRGVLSIDKDKPASEVRFDSVDSQPPPAFAEELEAEGESAAKPPRAPIHAHYYSPQFRLRELLWKRNAGHRPERPEFPECPVCSNKQPNKRPERPERPECPVCSNKQPNKRPECPECPECPEFPEFPVCSNKQPNKRPECPECPEFPEFPVCSNKQPNKRTECPERPECPVCSNKQPNKRAQLV